MKNKLPTSGEIVKYMIGQGHTQKELAVILDVDRSYISHVLKGDRNLTVDHLEKLGEAVNMTFPELFIKAIPVESVPKKLRDSYTAFLGAIKQTDTCLRHLRESRQKRVRKATA